jgi:hypothetical protein
MAYRTLLYEMRFLNLNLIPPEARWKVKESNPFSVLIQAKWEKQKARRKMKSPGPLLDMR